MGIVVRFHSATSAGEAEARASSVMCEQPLASASRTKSSHRRGGIPRLRQCTTVETSTESSAANTVGPPRSLIVASDVSITPTIVGNSPTCQELTPCQPTIFLNYAELPTMGESLKALGRRLELTRLALGFASQVDFCAELKIDKTAYNPFEKGKRRITLDVAIRIKHRFAITLDWIYCNDPSGLPLKVTQQLNRTAA